MRVRQLAQLIPSAVADPIVVSGGPGNDIISVSFDPTNPLGRPDVIDGGGGFDILNLGVSTGSVTANFSDLSRPAVVTVTVRGQTAPIQLSVVNFEQFSFHGEDGDDNIHGGRYNDILIGGSPGGSGNNTMSGGAGDDTLDGGTGMLESGVDLLFGAAGNDTLLGLGVDDSVETVFGGPGSDTFHVATLLFVPGIPVSLFPVPDVIGDFSPGPGGDVLRFDSGLGAPPVRLSQVGASTGVEAWFYRGPDRGGEESYGWIPIVQLKNTNAALLTEDNIPGIGSAGPAPVGTALADTLKGTARSDVISAAGGNDTVALSREAE